MYCIYSLSLPDAVTAMRSFRAFEQASIVQLVILNIRVLNKRAMALQISCSGLQQVTSGHIWSQLFTSGHIWSQVVTSGHTCRIWSLQRQIHQSQFALVKQTGSVKWTELSVLHANVPNLDLIQQFTRSTSDLDFIQT